MAKLYPPYIEGTIPAFYKTTDSEGKGTAQLTVPFSMNRAVSKWEVTGFRLKLKNIFGDNRYLITAAEKVRDQLNADQKVVFTLNDSQIKQLTVGQSYKVQIAYDSDSGVGYYSTVGVVKYTTRPNLEISGLSTEVINMHRYSYIGKYSQIAYDYRQISINESNYKPNVYYIKNEESGEFTLSVGETYSSQIKYYIKTPSLDENNMKDATEKVYSYRFILRDLKENIIADSGYLLHNSNEDLNSYESQDMFSFPTDLEHRKVYYIQYIVVTNNGLEVASPRYRIMQKRSINPEMNASIEAALNYENGYIDIGMVGELDQDGVEKGATGSFLLTRSCSDDNFTVWNEILRFSLKGQKPSKFSYRDFTIEQGKDYIYSFQQYNDSGLYSERIKSNKVYADFEDAFLYDGKRQLKIKYNPKVSSFKTNRAETKMDTVGGKFPFILRNGNVEYKEFPLSGLISYHSDDKNLFLSDNKLGFENSSIDDRRPGTFRDEIEATDKYFENIFNASQGNTTQKETYEDIKDNYNKRKTLKDRIDDLHVRTTSPFGYNIQAERTFKLEVLDWLNNGKVKLFRSPTEGNYLIRLMNVSLSPEDRVGRMLHTFSSTAYEVDEYTHENMNKHGIISISEPLEKTLRFESIRLAEYDNKSLDDRYEPGFKYVLYKDLDANKFSNHVTKVLKSAFLPCYYKDSNKKFVQVPINDAYNKNKTYYKKNKFNEYKSIKLDKTTYDNIVNETKKSLLLNFYKLELINGQDAYIQVNASDSFDEYGSYYYRQSNNHLYYVKTGINLLKSKTVKSLRLTDMTPGDIFYLRFNNETNPRSFVIGATGSYLVDTNIDITYFGLPNDVRYTGTLTYSYYEDTSNLFNEIESIEITPVPAHQFVGSQGNIIEKIENVRDSISTVYYIHLHKRSIGTAYWNEKGDKKLYRHYENGKYSSLISSPTEIHSNIDSDYFEDSFMLYKYTRDKYLTAKAETVDPENNQIKIYKALEFYYDPWNPTQSIVTQDTYDRIKSQGASTDDLLIYSCNAYFNNKGMSVEDTINYKAESKDFIFSSISCDVGVAIEIGYELQSINYSIVNKKGYENLRVQYDEYLRVKNKLKEKLEKQDFEDQDKEAVESLRKQLKTKYNKFIYTLTMELMTWEAEQKS